VTVSALVEPGNPPAPATDQALVVRRPAETLAAPGWRFLAGWTTAWIAVGAVVSVGISFGAPEVAFIPILRVSVLYALIVGFSAYTTVRLVFPLLARLPFAVRLVLDGLILLSGTFFGSIAAVFLEPLFLLGQIRTNLLILALNTLLATVVAISLGTYDRMRRQIESSYRVQRERDALQHELTVARMVQRQLLPRQAPDVAGLELSGVCRQAIGVGGDYYDYVELEDGRVGLVIADVSGKGVSAALLMASLQASARSLFLTTADPGTLNARLNDALFRVSSERHYATAFVASYDPETRRLAYSRAGHLPPLVIRRDDAIECLEGGMPIGMLAGSTYDTGTMTLARGDLVALFTDGVSETASPDDEHFGPERLADLLRTHRKMPLEELVQMVLDALVRWSGPVAAHDDVTLVLARVR